MSGLLGFFTMQLVPAWLRPYIYGALALLGVFIAIWSYGEHEYHLGEAHIKSLMQATAVKVHEASTKITTQVITKYVPQVQYIRGKTQTIIKEVPKYVTQKDNSACTIPNSFVWLWNNSNQVQLPGDTPSIPGGASLIVLSDVATEHATEAGICLANEARIRATTEWLRQQKALYDR